MLSKLPLVVPKAAGFRALDDLRRVPWEELSHAYGKGTRKRGGRNPATGEPIFIRVEGVEVHLRNLFSENEDERDDAVNEGIFSVLWHQGTIYEATAYAVPFLLAIAADPATPTRSSIAYGLGLILISAFEEPTESGEGVIAAFEEARCWADAIATAGPPPLEQYVQLLLRLLHDRPQVTDALRAELDGAFAAVRSG